jgi:uncharacterized protein YjbI with pentapeptide repeats
MKPTIKCGKHLAEHANISGSQFHNVNLSAADFDDVNLSNTRFHNVNLSDIKVSAVQIGGASFKHNVKIIDCNIQGMTIDGVLVSDLLKEHKKRKG